MSFIEWRFVPTGWRRFIRNANRGDQAWREERSELFARVAATIQNAIAMTYQNHVFPGFSLPPVASGLYGSNISITSTDAGVLVNIYVDYAEDVEYGTGPHWPPADALELWVRDKFYLEGAEARRVAYVIGRRISEQGIRRQNIVQRSFDRFTRDELKYMVREAVENLAARMGFSTGTTFTTRFRGRTFRPEFEE